MSQPLRIGIAGLGTVGAGVVGLLGEQGDLLESRCGCRLQVAAVSARDKAKDRGVDLGNLRWLDDPLGLASDDGVDVVVELIGGEDGIAKSLCEAAIANGKHVVTANKALLAHHGTALALAAEGAGVSLGFEASVAGGIPIVKTLREGLAGNGIGRVYGILNGTCNYILSAMRDSGRDFDDILAETQELGYSEADPSLDIDGVDTAHKVALLASLAFGCRVDFGSVHTEGIRHITPMDIRFAEELGYRIKLLGLASVTGGELEQRVHPCMVPATAPIATVEGALNAVVAEGDYIDTLVLEGLGSGAGPTASAVLSDIVDIARGSVVPTFSVPAAELVALPARPMDRHRGGYYIRLMVVDRPGVFADVAAVLRDHDVSMESVLQRVRDPGEAVPVVMVLHDTQELKMMGALDEIGALDAVIEPPRMIRIESL